MTNDKQPGVPRISVPISKRLLWPPLGDSTLPLPVCGRRNPTTAHTVLQGPKLQVHSEGLHDSRCTSGKKPPWQLIYTRNHPPHHVTSPSGGIALAVSLSWMLQIREEGEADSALSHFGGSSVCSHSFLSPPPRWCSFFCLFLPLPTPVGSPLGFPVNGRRRHPQPFPIPWVRVRCTYALAVRPALTAESASDGCGVGVGDNSLFPPSSL